MRLINMIKVSSLLHCILLYSHNSYNISFDYKTRVTAVYKNYKILLGL